MKHFAHHLQDERLFDCYLSVQSGEALDPPVAEHFRGERRQFEPKAPAAALSLRRQHPICYQLRSIRAATSHTPSPSGCATRRI